MFSSFQISVIYAAQKQYGDSFVGVNSELGGAEKLVNSLTWHCETTLTNMATFYQKDNNNRKGTQTNFEEDIV